MPVFDDPPAIFEGMMSSEPDSTPRRRPPTIDLTATEVEAEQAAAANSSGTGDPGRDGAGPASGSGPRPGNGRPSHLAALVGSALAGAVVIAAIGAGLWFAGYLPSRQPATTASAPVSDNPALADVSNQLKQLQATLQAQQPDQGALSRVTAVEATAKAQADSLAVLTRRVDDLAAAQAATKTQADSLAALNRRTDEIAAAAQSALAQAKTAATTASGAASAADAAKSAAQNGVSQSDLNALSSRIAALETAVKNLTGEMSHLSGDVTHLSGDVAQQTSGADDRVARLTVAAEALRAAVERGAPYQTELDAVKSLGGDPSALPALAPFAGTGVPSAASLAQQLAALAPRLQQGTEPASNDASFLGRLENHAQRLVRVTPVDAPAGNDPHSVAARIEVDAAHADIAAAVADIAKLPSDVQSLAAPWLQKAQAREAALAAARKIAADALGALGKPVSQ